MVKKYRVEFTSKGTHWYGNRHFYNVSLAIKFAMAWTRNMRSGKWRVVNEHNNRTVADGNIGRAPILTVA